MDNEGNLIIVLEKCEANDALSIMERTHNFHFYAKTGIMIGVSGKTWQLQKKGGGDMGDKGRKDKNKHNKQDKNAKNTKNEAKKKKQEKAH